MSELLILVGAYLLGSVPFSYLVARATGHVDLRRVGSHNPGATNVLRAVGLLPALLALALDLAKGAAPVLLGRYFGLAPWLVGAAGVAAVAGHVWPLFLGFRGGKGVATAGGFFAALAPRPTLVTLLVFVTLVAWKRYVSLGSIAAAVAFPLLLVLATWSGWQKPLPRPQVAAAVAVSLLVLVRHAANARRLLAGTEARLGERLNAGAS